MGYSKSAPTNVEQERDGLLTKNNNVYKSERKETIYMLFFTKSNLKSAKTYKSQQVLLSRKTLYSGISKLIL